MQYTSHGSWAKYETWNQVDVDLILSLMMVTILSIYIYMHLIQWMPDSILKLSYHISPWQKKILFNDDIFLNLYHNLLSWTKWVCTWRKCVWGRALCPRLHRQRALPPSRFPVSGVSWEWSVSVVTTSRCAAESACDLLQWSCMYEYDVYIRVWCEIFNQVLKQDFWGLNKLNARSSSAMNLSKICVSRKV